MTTSVYRGKHYSVVGTSHDWGVTFEVKPIKTESTGMAPPVVRFSDGHFYLYGFREPKPRRWYQLWLYRRRSIQEAAAVAVKRCVEADALYTMQLEQEQDAARQLQATAEVQRIAAEL